MAGAMSAPAEPPRALVIGMGNVLTGDDGFGVRVIEALELDASLPAGIRLLEVGIGGIHMVQELMTGYDALIVVDAVDRGGAPGTIYTLEPQVAEIADLTDAERSEFLADTHYAVPRKALMLARALGVLPEQVYIVGCQPVSTELGIGLSPIVSRAVGAAAARVRSLLGEIRSGAAVAAGR